MSIILRSYVRYRPLRTFLYLSILPGLVGLGLCIRFLYFYFSGGGSGHLQSLLLATILLLLSFLLIVLGVLGDLIGSNQKLIYNVLHLTRKLMADNKRQRQ